MAKKTIKYLENGEYHDATVKDVGVIEELKTESKDNLVEAINEIFLGGGKGFSDLQQKVDESTQAAQNAQQAANNLQQKLDEVAQNVGLSDEEVQKIINQAVEDAKRAQAEALQAYKDAQKELDDSMAQFMEEQKAINKELEQAKADIQGDIDQKNTEIEQINTVIESTKSDLTATSARLASVRNDLTNAQMDWGKVRQEITNINGKLDSKMSNTDFDEYKERIERNETEITQTKNELQSKATKQDLDGLTGTVTTQGSSITQLAGKIEQKVSKDTLANDVDDFQVKKANIFTGTREFIGWEFSDKALGRVNDDIYNHAKVAELHNGSNLSITVDGLEVGKTYSVSIFAKASANSNTSGVKVTVDNGKSYSGLMRTVYTPHDTKVTTNWQRYYATIVASATTMKFVFDRSGMTSDITLYLNRPKLEVGGTVYAWEDNAQDIYKRVEHTEAQFDVYNDQISGIVKRQTETDKKIENVSSTFTQRADGIEANAKKYTNDKVTGLTEEFSGRLKATSQELSTEYEKQTNAKIGALSDGGSNLILNSSFLVTDNNGNATLENWRDTSSKVSLTKPNGLDGTWIKVNRATTGTALGARSNYFPVKQGKLVVGVDVALDGTGNISPYVLRIEYYDVSNNRVNYEDITLQKLGLSASQITKSGSNFRYARGVYKTSNDRSDVAKACIVVPETITGYDMYLTNFFAKFSDVNDGTYEVNPLDQQASLIKQRTKIEQDSEKINLLNTQTEKLGNDIKATNTSVNVLKGEVDLKASQSTVNDLTNRVAKNAADIKVFPDKIKSEVSEVSKKIDGVNDKVDNIKVGGTNLIPHSEVDTIRGDTDYWVFSTGNINNYGGRYNPTDKSLELEAHIKDTNYQFLQWQQQNNVLMNTELAHLQVGDVLTISAEVYIQNPNMSGNITLGFRVNPRTNYNSYFSTERGIDLRNLKTGWQRVSATGTITQKYLDCMNDVQLMRILLAANGLKENNKIAFRKIKAEKGNIATDWSPATEDTDASIESVKTVATQTKDGFDRLTQKTGYNASTGEFSKITTQINEGIKGVSTQVSSVSNRLDNLSVGGVNLMRNTTRDYVKFTGGGWGVDYLTPNHQAVDTPVEGGETYTFSAWVKNDSSSAGRIDLEIYQYNAKGENKENGSSSEVGVWVSPGEEKRLVFTKTLLADTTRVKFHTRNRDKNGTVTYWTKMAQVEKGNIVTDWSPATEDLQEGINVATTKATQTDTKFERMISQIQYNDSTGEIGKYEHKITELANGTQEKISAIRTDSDKKLQSATQTLTNKIGDLESTVRTNTTNLGQYRQEMTNSAKEWSTKFTSVQTDMSSVSNRLDNLGQTNLYYNSEFAYSNGNNHNVDGITSTGNIAYSVNGRYANYRGSNSMYAHTTGGMTDYKYIEHTKDNYVKVSPGEIVSASVTVWTTGDSSTPRDGYAICTISFYKDLNSSRMGYKEVSVAAKDMAYPNYKTLKVENVTVPSGANYMILHLIVRGAADWHFSQPMLVKSDKVGAYVPSTQLQLNDISSRTQFLQDDKQFLLRIQQVGGATQADVNSANSKIGILQGQIIANANKFNTVYTKTDVDNKINPLNSRTEFLQDNSKFLLRVQQAGGATKADVNSANSKIGDLSTRVKNTEVAITSGGVTINGDTKIGEGFTLSADRIKAGTMQTKGLIMSNELGSNIEFTQDGLDIQKADNREAYYTFGGQGMDFWRMSRDEAMDDYPNHHKPGYVHLGSMIALDNEYTKSVNRPDQKHTNAPSNNNGIGFVLDVTGGADNFAILQKGAEYRKGEKWGRINFNETVNNSHFPIWEINATGYGSHAWLQSGFNRGRGIFNYSNLYFYTDPVIGTEHDPDGKDYYPIERIGLVGNDGWGGLAVWADNKNVVSIRTNDEYPVVANGLIISKHTGDNDGVYIGGDGRQWVNLINTRNVRADVSSKDGRHYSNHLGSMFLYELRYGALTKTSQLSKKTDIKPLDIEDFYSKILSIDLYRYKYKSQKENEKYRYGGIIDDVNEVKQYNLPQEFISTSGEGIDDSNLIAGLIATAKIQAKEIEKLNFRILELERGKIDG